MGTRRRSFKKCVGDTYLLNAKPNKVAEDVARADDVTMTSTRKHFPCAITSARKHVRGKGRDGAEKEKRAGEEKRGRTVG